LEGNDGGFSVAADFMPEYEAVADEEIHERAGGHGHQIRNQVVRGRMSHQHCHDEEIAR
jgi:hypothetical protein